MTRATIAVIGGTGPQGRGLGYRWARHGHPVVIGSRSVARAEETAESIIRREPDGKVEAADNAAAAAMADVVVVAVPYDGHAGLVEQLADSLAGKVVVSCVNPLGFDATGPYGLVVAAGSAAEELAALAPKARVVGAFHHVSAPTLWRHGDQPHDEDVLVCGDDPDAKQVVIGLARAVTGRDGVDAGALRLARHLEPMAAVLVSINRRYQVRSGLLVSGLPEVPHPG
ncbi:MAG: NADPH-dependent F420 reductase [uncultured Nocardioidaceae bacterium]|uniref:NADPH-dependent F420 reductase n=1 Tax=uncultured Nocardioidaceae bacterium TaxID=253824 RepID=A0A6J4M1Q3_9ACTN|nr:MAG: NADPH-dependent F420 reductase [uncultured Nocardioidaceae bacterium]